MEWNFEAKINQMAHSHHDPCLVFTPSLATVLQPGPVIKPVCASLYTLAASVAQCVHVGLVPADCDGYTDPVISRHTS